MGARKNGRARVLSCAHLFPSACYAGYESVYKVYDYQNLAQITYFREL